MSIYLLLLRVTSFSWGSGPQNESVVVRSSHAPFFFVSPTVTVTELLLPETATNDQVGQTVVSWKSGPNPYPFDYSVKCYAVDSADADVATCQEIDNLTPVGDVVSGKVPMIHSKVDVTYDGFTDKYVDCYIRVSGAAGTKSKCTYAGRATIPDATTI